MLAGMYAYVHMHATRGPLQQVQHARVDGSRVKELQRDAALAQHTRAQLRNGKGSRGGGSGAEEQNGRARHKLGVVKGAITLVLLSACPRSACPAYSPNLCEL